MDSLAAAWRFAAVAVVVLVVQTELFAELRFFGVMPELMLGLTVAAGWNSTPDRGAIAGFTAGLLYDLFLATPFALTAMTYTMVGYGIGVIGTGVADTSENMVRRATSLIGVAAGITGFALAGELLADEDLVNTHLVTILAVAPLYTLVAMPLLHRVAYWALAPRGALGATTRRSISRVQ